MGYTYVIGLIELRTVKASSATANVISEISPHGFWTWPARVVERFRVQSCCSMLVVAMAYFQTSLREHFSPITRKSAVARRSTVAGTPEHAHPTLFHSFLLARTRFLGTALGVASGTASAFLFVALALALPFGAAFSAAAFGAAVFAALVFLKSVSMILKSHMVGHGREVMGPTQSKEPNF